MARAADHSDKETDAWLDAFVEKMGKPGPDEKVHFKERRQNGVGVGLDDAGKLVRASGAPSKD